MGLGNPFDEAVKAETSQLISHAALGELVRVLAEQRGQIIQRVSIGEGRRQQVEDQQGVSDEIKETPDGTITSMRIPNTTRWIGRWRTPTHFCFARSTCTTRFSTWGSIR